MDTPIAPITPREAAHPPLQNLPDFVVAAFNALIQHRYTGGSANIPQDDVVLRIIAEAQRMGQRLDRAAIFENRWLDIERLYERAGWNVVYVKAHGWAGSAGQSQFIFTAKG